MDVINLTTYNAVTFEMTMLCSVMVKPILMRCGQIKLSNSNLLVQFFVNYRQVKINDFSLDSLLKSVDQ